VGVFQTGRACSLARPRPPAHGSPPYNGRLTRVQEFGAQSTQHLPGTCVAPCASKGTGFLFKFPLRGLAAGTGSPFLRDSKGRSYCPAPTQLADPVAVHMMSQREVSAPGAAFHPGHLRPVPWPFCHMGQAQGGALLGPCLFPAVKASVTLCSHPAISGCEHTAHTVPVQTPALPPPGSEDMGR
jgi:hypothetical protein